MIYNLKNNLNSFYYNIILGFFFKNILKICINFLFFLIFIYFISLFTNFFFNNDFFFFNIIFYNYKLISLFDFLLYSFIFFFNEFIFNLNILNFKYFFDNYDLFIYIHIMETWNLIFEYFITIYYIFINNYDAEEINSINWYFIWNLLVPGIMFIVVDICHPIADWYVYNVIFPISDIIENENFNLLHIIQKKFNSILDVIYNIFLNKMFYNFNFIFIKLKFLFFNNFNFILSCLFILPLLQLFFLYFFKNIKIILYLIILKFNLIIFLFKILNNFEIINNIFFFMKFSDFFNFYIIFNIDIISLSFIFLSDFLNIICFLLIWYNIKYKKNYYILLLILCNFFLILIFLSNDLFIFYIFFELILLPMFFLISQWGSRLRKIHASLQFFLYTLLGSLLFLYGLLYLNINYNTTDFLILKYLIINKTDQIILFITFFLAFGIKVPIYPFHLWLPEAHVEAPTAGSVLLAGILLKLGTYGFLKFFFILLPYSSLYFLPLINILCIFGMTYSSFVILKQIDIKKIIAYSSIIHMNYTILGLFNLNFFNFYGSFFLMLSHGIVSSALFVLIGFLYERYHTRIIFYYGNLIQIMPIFGIYFFLFTLGNIGFPGTSSFIGEFLIFIGLVNSNFFIAIFSLLSLFISVIYSFLLYNKLFFFNIIVYNNILIKFSDLNKREFIILFILTLFMFFYGIYTKSFFNLHYYNLNDLFLLSKYKILLLNKL
jgi:NADH-quinone oxidoreductase subunit M